MRASDMMRRDDEDGRVEEAKYVITRVHWLLRIVNVFREGTWCIRFR